MRYSILSLIVTSLLLLNQQEVCFAQTSQRPNVIIIMTDDQGYGELSVHGNPVLKTPELDKLHQESIRLTDFHVAPMCTPTRGQLITGIDAVKNGATNVSSGRTLLRKDLRTMADYFKDSNYNTGIFGKWHLGDNYPYRPEDRGFEESLWFPSSHIGSVPDYWGNDYFDDVYIRNGKRETFEGYCTDVFFDQAKGFMKKAAENEKPFFVYLPTNTPHQPFYAKPGDIEEMERIINDSEFAGMEESTKEKLIRYLAMIRNIDQNVGDLQKFLKDNKLDKNTILIFLTDNGSTFGPKYYNAGMRGKKVQLYEGGHRVPFFIKWPAGNIGEPRDVDGLTQVQDILPTLLELCGIQKDEESDFDGISLAGVIKGQEEIDPERVLWINFSRMPFSNYPSPYASSIIEKSGAAVLWKDWRLLNQRELYNLVEDPLQQHNVIDQYPDVVHKMETHLDKFWQEAKEVVNEPQRVIIGAPEENPSVLTACEWMDVFLDRQLQVARGDTKNSYWLLNVAEAGKYTFELRRWPKETGAPLQGSVDSGRSFPIAYARIFLKGEAGEFMRRKKVSSSDQGSQFTVNLEKGPVALHTWFDDKNGNNIVGAYYVYVEKEEVSDVQ
ncbi:arylsulfatase [Echinicola soli]|uniref:Arylsulfatase n=1 Tax=Echinicola soli TaxID=2591634 RepID=A0A514CNA5_9BACT|nr:arylsulfatase [Echinicola soli]QDH81305.1 arylsulfatase [Echinicola soli]